MQLNHLRYIVEIDRTGSISKAAQNLLLTQPHLSNAVSDLEEKLGIKIFTRTNRGVITTEEGFIFLSYAKDIINQMENLEKLYSEQKKNSTTLRVAWQVATARPVFSFINTIPDSGPVNINLVEGGHLNTVKAVAEKEADVGVFHIPMEQIGEYERYAKKHDLILKKLWKTKPFILVSSKSDLAEESLITDSMLSSKYIQLIYRPEGIYDLPHTIASVSREIQIYERNIYFNNRAILQEVLDACPNTYILGLTLDHGLAKKYNLTALPQDLASLRDVYYLNVVLHQKHPISKELNWYLKYLENLKNPDHPDWTVGPKPLPID